MRIAYRVRQFWHAIFARPTPDDLSLARSVLTSPQMQLFDQLQPSEQVHSIKICRRLMQQGETQPDLLVAALLHDVGKSRYPLHLWDRVLIVLAGAFFPEKMKIWGQAQPQGWQRAFVVAQRHPAWGAEMAARVGASPLTVTIIQRHQEPASPKNGRDAAEEMLLHLQNLDEGF